MGFNTKTYTEMVIRDLDDLDDLGCSYFRNPPITVYYCLIESSSPPCISGDNSRETREGHLMAQTRLAAENRSTDDLLVY